MRGRVWEEENRPRLALLRRRRQVWTAAFRANEPAVVGDSAFPAADRWALRTIYPVDRPASTVADRCGNRRVYSSVALTVELRTIP